MSERSERVARLAEAIAEIQAAGPESAEAAERDEEELSRVREQALRLLDQRARSRVELRRRLLAKDEPEELVDDVLDRLEAAGLIDDGEFARQWVRQRAQRRGKSRLALDRELRDKGVSGAVRSDALEELSRAEEDDIARALARKKAASIKSEPEGYQERVKQLRRIVGVLARRGFPESAALPIAVEALDERLAEIADEAEG
ncbi:regulatory protein RecX [Corynebacterium otitidis]|uniref:regulatory protein RecX n=1 Tax=Corynebacterium otitidis TaxID=29321 RepID=UPI0006282809|nr:regulatory protein RecX [Corynebacterium otitidis]KKO83940.1 recombinase RecX [Corynebacterium otitidis]